MNTFFVGNEQGEKDSRGEREVWSIPTSHPELRLLEVYEHL